MEMIGHALKGNHIINVYVDSGKKMVSSIGEEDESHVADYLESVAEDEEIANDATVAKEVNFVDEAYDSENNEDEDYAPVEESESDDGLSDHDLASDDDEYLEARKNTKKYRRNFIHENEDAPEYRSIDSFADCDREMQSDYEDSAGEMNSDSTSSEDIVNEEGCSSRMKKSKVIYDPKCDHKTHQFVLGMRFENGGQCKFAIQKQAILNGHDIRFTRINKKRVEAKCVEGCPWKLYASSISREGRFAIKSYIGEHKCSRDMQTRQTNASWIAMEYLDHFRRNPNWKVEELEFDILKHYAVKPSKWKLYRGKWKALDMLRGSVIEHYASLRSYMAELLRVDTEGRFEYLLDAGSLFKAFYVSFRALRKGFLHGCRPIIGFDGCFLKTFLGGALLCATGKDGNNQMFPIAWAVVETENESCWKWFLTILFEYLGVTAGLGWTFISDQQKGLINAIKELAPFAEHRNCARHIYMNWKKEHKGQSLKNIYWRCVRSSYMV